MGLRVPADLVGYDPHKLRSDAVAGLTVAIFAIPQSMAYASIAEIPIEYGLYSAVTVTIIATIFTSCSRLIHGPTNAIVVMIADMNLMSVLADQGIEVSPANFMRVVFLLTLLIGSIQLLGALLRFGELTNYISSSVVVGFTVAAAILIVVRQIPKLLGLDPLEARSTLEILRHSISNFDQVRLPTLTLGLSCTIFILVYRRARRPLTEALLKARPALAMLGRMLRNAPGALFAIVGAALVMKVLDAPQLGIAFVEVAPASLPPPSWPIFDWELTKALLPGAAAIAVVGQIEAVSTGRVIARIDRRPFNPNDQLWSEALANVGGAFLSSFAGSSSFTRSALNVDVGAVSRLSGIFCGLFVALFVFLLGPMLGAIPTVALSGVLVAVAFRLVETHRIIHAWRASWTEAAIVSATALCGVLISLEGAILLGVALSFFFYIPRAATIQVRRLVLDEGGFVREAKEGEAETGPSILDIEGALFFGALPALEDALNRLAAEPGSHRIIRIQNAHHLDAATSEALIGFVRREQGLHRTVILCGVRPHHLPVLRRVGLIERLGESNVFFEREDSPRSSAMRAIEAARSRSSKEA